MSYSEFMTVDIDTGVLCCEDCGALVPHDRRIIHNEHHTRLAYLKTALGRLEAVEAEQ